MSVMYRQWDFQRVETVNHQGKAMAIAEARPLGQPEAPSVFLYNILDLESGQKETDQAWRDETYWTGFRELAFPKQVRCIGMSLLTVDAASAFDAATAVKCWHVLSDGACLYLFRALSVDGRCSVFANRYVLARQPGENRGEAGPLTLMLKTEARYRRSQMRETPENERDTPSPQDPEGRFFVEPTAHFSMLEPRDGLFAVTLAPSDKPGRARWQFFTAGAGAELAAWSLLRDDNGWADLADKSIDAERAVIQPDRIFTIRHQNEGPLTLVGRPSTLVFQRQEATATALGTPQRGLTGPRMLLLARMRPAADQGEPTPSELTAVDFDLAAGAPNIPETVTIGDVVPAKTALSLAEDVVIAPNVDPTEEAMTACLWMRHQGGDGLLVSRRDETGEIPGGFQLEWQAQHAEIQATFVLQDPEGQTQTLAISAPAPTSFVWHHLAVAFQAAGDEGTLRLFVDGRLASEKGFTIGQARLLTKAPLCFGGPFRHDESYVLGAMPQAHFNGDLDDLRIWAAFLDAEDLDIYREIDNPPDALIGYWKLDDGHEGHESIARDSSRNGNNATVHGARWITQTAPVSDAQDGDDALSSGMGRLAFANFRDLSDPAPLNGADGLVHLYLHGKAGDETQLLALQYDASVARAQFAAAWQAGDQTGSLLLLARAAGAGPNRWLADLETDGAPSLARFSVAADDETTEQWRALPSHVNGFAAVLNGQAADEPLDPQVQRGDKVFYDYAGARPIIPLPTENADGDPALLVGAQSGRTPSLLPLTRASLAGEQGHAELRVDMTAEDSAINDIQRGWTFTLSQRVDRNVHAATTTINGTTWLAPAGRLVRLVSGQGALYFAASDRVKSLAITVASDGGDPARAKITTHLEKAVGDPLTVVWPNLPRTPRDLARILNGRDAEYPYSPEMKAVAASFVVTTTNAHAPIANGQGKQLGTENPFSCAAFFSAVRNGAAGRLADAAELKALRQGVARQGTMNGPLNASHFFSARLFETSTNGAVARLRPGPAVLHQPGNFGGWVPEPPSVAGYFDRKGGATIARRDWDDRTASVLAPAGDFAMETWIRLDEEGPSGHPRIATVHGPPDQPLARYLLGLDMVEALLLEKQSSKMLAKTVASPLSERTPFSLTFWLKLPKTGEQIGSVAQLIAADEKALFNVDVSLKFLTFSFARANPGQNGKADRVQVLLPEGLRGSWQFVSCIYEPGEEGQGRGQIFMGGISAAAAFQTIATQSLCAVNLGALDPKWAKNFNIAADGCQRPIAGVGVWNRALAREEIVGLKTNGGPGARGLIAYWSFSDIVGNGVPNAVENGPKWTGELADARLAAGPGFHLVAGAGERLAATLTHPVQGGRWVHLAAVAEDNVALDFDGEDLAFVENSDNLSPGKAFSIDAVFSYRGPVPGSHFGCLFAKSDALARDASYILGVRDDGRVVFRFWVDTPQGKRGYDLTAAVAIRRDRPYYLAAGAALVTAGQDAGNRKTTLEAQIFLFDLTTGEAHPRRLADLDQWTENAEKVCFHRAGARAAIGCLSDMPEPGMTAADRGFFRGAVGSLRYWDRLLGGDAEILARSPRLPGTVGGPVAYWKCDEGKGTVARDRVGGQDATLTRADLWRASRLNTAFTIYVDGQKTQTRPMILAEMGMADAYGDSNLISVGALQRKGTVGLDIHGQLDDLRVWSRALAAEEILDNRHAQLRGDERGLAAYWHFSTGSGPHVKDGSAHGNHLRIDDATVEDFWKRSEAPISNEPPQIRNMLHGEDTAWVVRDAISPAAVEYGELQEDRDGVKRGVLKRCCAYLSDSEGDARACTLETEFQLGELELRYIGQVQTKPTLIGYIEGAPPTPSENLTRPYWLTPLAPAYQAYDGVSSVALTEAQETAAVYSAEHAYSGSVSVSGAFGFAADIEQEAGSPVFFTKVIKLAGANQLVGSLETGLESIQTAEQSIGGTKTVINELSAGGDWEDDSRLVNDEVGRRYVPDNAGYALVKSSVADLYAMHLRKTGTLIAMQLVADPETPEDYNVVIFPMAPGYTKQGTLDGKVGFANDPDYPDADQQRGSYFKPVEAYDLAAQVAAYEADLEADYRNFNTFEALFKATPEDSARQGATVPYDFDAGLNKRDMVNSYVWTADGGFFAESQQAIASRQESWGSSFNLNVQLGVHGEASMIFGGVGVAGELDALAGFSLNRTVVKTKESGRNFELGVDLDVESFLQKYDREANAFDGESTPGKVTSYRFKTFYLAPRQAAFDDFFNRVVQQDWLHESNQPEAVALRGAMAQTNPVWRVLHRVTHVSRVPRPFGEPPQRDDGKPARALIHQDANRIIIQLVADALTAVEPTPEAIGAAVAKVFEDLKQTVAWWAAFIAEAERDRGSQAYRDLNLLRQTTLSYMLARFQTGGDGAPNPPRSLVSGMER